MADNVSELTIELEAPAEQADEGLSKLSSALLRLKKAVDDINTDKLEELKSSIKGFDISLDAAKGISTFANAMKTLATVTGDFNTKKPQNEVSDFEHSLKAVTDALSTMYGVPRSQFKLLEKQLRDAANSTKDVKEMYQTDLFGTQSVTWADEIAKEIHHTEKVFVEADDAYKELIADIKAANADANGIKLNFSYKELQAENKSIAKTLGQGFTFNDRIDKAQTSFDSWVNGLSESSKVLLGVTDGVTDYAKVFERLVEIKQEYSRGGKIFEVENGSIKEITKSAQEAIDTLRYVKDREVEIHKEEQQAENKFPQHLQEVVDAANGLSVTTETGTALKELGNGFRVIANSIKKLSDVDTGKLHEIVSAVSSVGSTLGNLGSNNKVSIKISSDGVKGSVKALENVKEQFDGLRQKAQQASQVVGQTTSDNVSEEDREIAKHAENIKRLDDLIQKRKEYAAIIAGMERGSVGINVDTFIKARDALEKVNKEIAGLSSQMGKSVEFVAADTIAQKLTPIIRDIEKYKALISDMDRGNIAFDEEQYINAKRKIEELTKEYQKLADTLSKKLRATGLDGLSQTIQGVIDKQKELQQTISGMESGQLGFDWKQYQKSVVEVDKLTNAMQIFRTVASMGTPKGLQMLGGAFKDLGSKMNSLANFGSKALKIFAAPFVAISNQIRKQTTNIKADFEKMSKGVQAATKKMSDFWKRSMKTFSFMLVRKAITAVLGDIKTAVDSLAIWSKHMGTPFNDSISNIVADFKYMARAILAAVEPLINAVAPILDKLADLLSNLSQKVASFFAILTGQNYIMKAKKNVTDYAKSVEKASKTAKNGLQSFDELNNITTNQDQQAQDPLAGWKDEWEKLPVDETMRDLADKIKQIAKDLWWPIGQAWDAMKDYVLGGWKYMTEQIKLLAKDIWRDFLRVWKSDTVVDIFKDIFGIVGDIEYGIGHLAKHFREAWNNNENGYHILKNIAEIVKILTGWARQVSLYFRDWANKRNFNPLLESLVKLTESLKRVADFAGGVFYDVMTKGVMEFIGWFIDKGLPDINNAIANVLDAFNFDKIRKDLQPVIVSIEKLLEHLVGGVTKAFEFLGKHIAEWFNSDKFTKFTQAISRIMDVFTEDRIATVLEGIGLGFLRIAEAIADIVSSDTVINLFENIGKWIDEKGVEGIAKAIEGLAKAIVGLTIGAAIFTGIGTAIKGFAKIVFVKNIWDIAKGMKGISTAADGADKVSHFTKALEGLGKVKTNVLGKIADPFSKIGAMDISGGLTLAQFLTTDMTALVSSGAVSMGAAIASEILAGLIAFLGGAEIGKTVAKLIFPDDKELYESYSGIKGTFQMIKDTADDIFKKDADGKTGLQTLFDMNSAKADFASTGFTKDNAYEKALELMREGIGLTKEQLASLRTDFGLTSEQMSNLTRVNQDIQAIADGTKMKFSEGAQAILDETDALKQQEKQIKRIGFSVEEYKKKLRAQVGTGEYKDKIDFNNFDTKQYQNKAFGTEISIDNLKAQRDELVAEVRTLQEASNSMAIVKQEDIDKMNELNNKIRELNNQIANADTSKSQETGKNIFDGIIEGMEIGLASISLGPVLSVPLIKKINEIFGIESPATTMYDTGKNIVLGIFKGFEEVDFISEMQAWWDTNVAPWFTLEKWAELSDGIKTGIKTKWDETVGQWATDITTWWNESVMPWFTADKWTELLSGIPTAFKTTFKVAVNGAIEALNKLLEGLEKLINDALGGDGLGKLSEYAAKLGVDVELDFSPIKLPKIPTFASGGIVEDGLFFANHNEMIGGFGNGKTAVANNDQITTGIANAVSNANAESNALMRQMVGLMEQFVDKDFSIGDDAVYASYKRGEARYTKRYGY